MIICKTNHLILHYRNRDGCSQDASDSLTNKVVSRNGTKLYGEFNRLLNTGDSSDIAVSMTSPMTVIWAGRTNRMIGNYGNNITNIF